ncbi:MAG: hypothetical protein ACRDH8_12885 [Actinomycetota bacterium]
MKLKELGWRELHLGGGLILTAIKGYKVDDIVGFVFRHPSAVGKAIPGGGSCEGLIPITPEYAKGEECWEVRSWNLLTIEPSFACTIHPEVHGRITGGLWVDQ